MSRIDELKNNGTIVELNQQQLRVLLGGNGPGEGEGDDPGFGDPNLEPSLFRRDLLD
jgi:hypothetical protein